MYQILASSFAHIYFMDIQLKNHLNGCGTLTLRGNSTGPILGVIPNSHQFESPHLLKEKPCAYRGIHSQQSITCPPGFSRDARIYGTLALTPKIIKRVKKKKDVIHYMMVHALAILACTTFTRKLKTDFVSHCVRYTASLFDAL